MKLVFLLIAILINFFNHSLIKSEEKINSGNSNIENIVKKESINGDKTEIKKIHIVKIGDTISSISKSYSINKDLIIKLNKLKDENLNGWVAGCDICQDVCPWNKSVPYNNTVETTPKQWIKNLNVESLNWDDKTWEENLKGTTLNRIKPWMWKRNMEANLRNKK